MRMFLAITITKVVVVVFNKLAYSPYLNLNINILYGAGCRISGNEYANWTTITLLIAIRTFKLGLPLNTHLIEYSRQVVSIGT